jgi:hypothetical protein
MTIDDKYQITPDENAMVRLEAAAFRRLVSHLRERTDVQNIDLMNLAGFCRNCLSNWLKDAADRENLGLGREAARAHIYGMPYDEWKTRFQQEPHSAAELRPMSAADDAKRRG